MTAEATAAPGAPPSLAAGDADPTGATAGAGIAAATGSADRDGPGARPADGRGAIGTPSGGIQAGRARVTVDEGSGASGAAALL